MKAIYTAEQIQELTGYLNMLGNANPDDGILKCKLITLCSNIIENPTEIEEGDADEHNEEDNPKHEQRQAE